MDETFFISNVYVPCDLFEAPFAGWLSHAAISLLLVELYTM